MHRLSDAQLDQISWMVSNLHAFKAYTYINKWVECVMICVAAHGKMKNCWTYDYCFAALLQRPFVPNAFNTKEDSTKNKLVFENAKYAEDYRKGRPKDPVKLMDKILDFLHLKVNKPERVLSAMYGRGYFPNLRNFLRNCLDFLGGIFC